MKTVSEIVLLAMLLTWNLTAAARGGEEEIKCAELTAEELAESLTSSAPRATSDIFLGWHYFAFHASNHPKNSTSHRLLTRATLDAWIREQLVASVRNESDGSICLATQEQLTEMMSSIDHQNADWLLTIIRKEGWFHFADYGTALNDAAWLITQHADQHTELQTQVLDIVAGAPLELEQRARKFAYLSDRVSINTGRQQKFGTQGRCVSPGKWEPWPNQGDADTARGEIGLQPIAEYAAVVSSRCP